MASAPPPDLHAVVSRVQLIGRSDGRVKSLRGFDKSRHVEPDAVNAATTAFLGRLCAAELAEEAEDWFQRTRSGLGYKRKDLSLDLSPPVAVLTAKDFTFEVGYALEDRSPEQFVVTRTLHQVGRLALVAQPEFDALFRGAFTELSFLLRKGVQVEAVIDAVEGLDEAEGFTVKYPSDCQTCTLAVAGVDAVVVCDGASLTMVFPRTGSPRELLDAFEAVRRGFGLTRQRALAGLLG